MRADVGTQRSYISREEATLPTISVEGPFSSLIIDVQKGRVVQKFYLIGVYLHASLPDVMAEVNPEHKPNMRI